MNPYKKQYTTSASNGAPSKTISVLVAVQDKASCNITFTP